MKTMKLTATVSYLIIKKAIYVHVQYTVKCLWMCEKLIRLLAHSKSLAVKIVKKTTSEMANGQNSNEFVSVIENHYRM